MVKSRTFTGTDAGTLKNILVTAISVTGDGTARTVTFRDNSASLNVIGVVSVGAAATFVLHLPEPLGVSALYITVSGGSPSVSIFYE